MLLAGGFSIRRQDIIVFRYPLDPRQHFVKRVVAVPGDRVRLIDKHTDDYTQLSLVSFYVGFILPVMVEVQYFRYN